MYKGDRVGKDIEVCGIKRYIVPSTAVVLEYIRKSKLSKTLIYLKKMNGIKALHDANNITEPAAVRTLGFR